MSVFSSQFTDIEDDNSFSQNSICDKIVIDAGNLSDDFEAIASELDNFESFLIADYDEIIAKRNLTEATKYVSTTDSFF